MAEDSNELRELLHFLLPGLQISNVAKASGQRVVYYCDFQNEAESPTGIPDGAVVLKVAKSDSADAIAYLQREIDVLNSLNVDCFPTLFHNDVFSVDPRTEQPISPRLFITIEEMIESRPLSACAADFRDPCSTLQLARQLVEALNHLWSHRSRIVHRDLKPDNILVRPNGSIVVIDLGITREEGAEGETKTGFYGPCTPGYCSPEQAQYKKERITYKTDFFCLGIILYELLTGIQPFRSSVGSSDLFAVFERVVRFNPPSPHQTSDVPLAISNLVMDLLKKRPFERPRTPGLLLARIDELFEECCDD